MPKKVNWPALLIECAGFFIGIMVGVNLGFIIALFYFYFPWGI